MIAQHFHHTNPCWAASVGSFALLLLLFGQHQSCRSVSSTAMYPRIKMNKVGMMFFSRMFSRLLFASSFSLCFRTSCSYSWKGMHSNDYCFNTFALVRASNGSLLWHLSNCGICSICVCECSSGSIQFKERASISPAPESRLSKAPQNNVMKQWCG